MIYIIDARL